MSRAAWARDYRARRKANGGNPVRYTEFNRRGSPEPDPEIRKRRDGRREHLREKYGLSLAEYDALMNAQSGVCKICGEPERAVASSGIVLSLSVDHDHATGKVRGLLCRHCNIAVGWLEKAANLDGLLAYLDIATVTSREV